MIGKKQLLAAALRHTGAMRGLELLRRRGLCQRLVVFNYHRIRPDGPDFSTDLEEYVFDTCASTFAAQMRWLARHTQVLSEAQLMRCLETPRRFPRPASMITFDDAYRDTFSIAYPILRDLGLPATLFVPTGLIEGRQLGWWDVIAYLIKRARSPRIELDGERFALPRQRREAADFFQRRMKRLPRRQTSDLLSRLARACAADPPPPALMDRELMTWDDVRQVAADNFTIGCHTHSHLVLSTLDAADQQLELSRSRSMLEQRLDREIHSVAYPVGEPRYLTPETEQIAARCGLQLGFSYLSGSNHWSRINPLCISRVAPLDDLSSFTGLTVLPELFSLTPGP